MEELEVMARILSSKSHIRPMGKLGPRKEKQFAQVHSVAELRLEPSSGMGI